MQDAPAVARAHAPPEAEVSLIPGGHRHVDIVEHDEARPTAHAPLGEEIVARSAAERRLADAGGEVVADAAAEPGSAEAGSEETVFSMLAARARTRPAAHLWITAGIGGIDALALMVARPSLWWVAAACLTVSAYAVWGLADRALVQSEGSAPAKWAPWGLRAVRVAAVVVGIAGGAATMVGFLGAALGRGSLGW